MISHYTNIYWWIRGEKWESWLIRDRKCNRRLSGTVRVGSFFIDYLKGVLNDSIIFETIGVWMFRWNIKRGEGEERQCFFFQKRKVFSDLRGGHNTWYRRSRRKPVKRKQIWVWEDPHVSDLEKNFSSNNNWLSTRTLWKKFSLKIFQEFCRSCCFRCK